MKCSQNFDWKGLIDHLRSISPFLYYNNPGNAGDSLIYLGMCKLFEKHSLRFKPFTEKDFCKNRRIVYSGGGNLVPYYNACSNFIKTHFKQFESFTLLPHTIHGNEELLKKLDSRFTLFCREKESYLHCKKYVKYKSNVEIAHDLAFALNLCPKKYKTSFLFPTLNFGRLIQWQSNIKEVNNFITSGGNQFFRTDKESSHPELATKENIDISAILSMNQKKHVRRITIAKTFLSLIQKTDFIQTDRLHVAIAGALLGIPTKLYPGIYHKNQSVWNYSLKPYFNNVTFNLIDKR
jgi:exopolysaccharide biosynthesis predicted pyruvyltransferase EpsI